MLQLALSLRFTMLLEAFLVYLYKQMDRQYHGMNHAQSGHISELFFSCWWCWYGVGLKDGCFHIPEVSQLIHLSH